MTLPSVHTLSILIFPISLVEFLAYLGVWGARNVNFSYFWNNNNNCEKLKNWTMLPTSNLYYNPTSLVGCRLCFWYFWFKMSDHQIFYNIFRTWKVFSSTKFFVPFTFPAWKIFLWHQFLYYFSNLENFLQQQFLRSAIQLSYFAFRQCFREKHHEIRNIHYTLFVFRECREKNKQKYEKVCEIYPTHKFFVKFYQVFKILFQNNINNLQNRWETLTES